MGDNKIAAPKEVLAIEYKKTPEEEEARPLSTPPPPREPVKVEAPVSEPPDLLVIFIFFVPFLYWYGIPR